jgi:protein gp37
MALTPQHIHQVLTKRPERMRQYVVALPDRAEEVREAARKNGCTLQACRDARDAVRDRPLPNVWLGTSTEDQARADERIPHLLATPAAVRFLSCEPLLGPLDLTPYLWGRAEPCADCPKDADCDCGYLPKHMLGEEPDLAWVIVGGESGRGFRDMREEWAESLQRQCADAGVAFFMKQMANKAPIPERLLVRQMPEEALL